MRASMGDTKPRQKKLAKEGKEFITACARSSTGSARSSTVPTNLCLHFVECHTSLGSHTLLNLFVLKWDAF